MTIKKHKKSDIKSIKKIALLAFKPNHDEHKKTLGNALFKAFYLDWQDKKKKTIDYLRNSSDCQIFVAKTDNKIIGFASFILNKEKPLTAEISTNAVDPKYQRQGIGSALYKHLIEELKALGIKYVKVSTSNEAAKKSYEKAGFTKKIQKTEYFMEL